MKDKVQRASLGKDNVQSLTENEMGQAGWGSHESPFTNAKKLGYQ